MLRSVVLCVFILVGLSADAIALRDVDEPEPGRLVVAETDQEVLDAYGGGWGWGWIGTASVRWRWNLDRIGLMWGQGDDEIDLETRVQRYQHQLDELWAEHDQLERGGESAEDINPLMVLLGLLTQGIEQLDPDKNRVFDPIVEFRNGRERIVVTDVQFDGDQITMVFPGGKGKIVASINKYNRLVGTWEFADELGEVQSFEFQGSLMGTVRCVVYELNASDKMRAFLEGTWKMEFETLGAATCEFVLLSPEPDLIDSQYFESHYVIATIRTEDQVFEHVIGRVRLYDRPWEEYGNQSFDFKLSYFDGEKALSLSGMLNAEGEIKGGFWTSMHGVDAWVGEKLGSGPVSKLKADRDRLFDGTTSSLPELLDRAGGKAKILFVEGRSGGISSEFHACIKELHSAYCDDIGFVSVRFHTSRNLVDSGKHIEEYRVGRGEDWECLYVHSRDLVAFDSDYPSIEMDNYYPTLFLLGPDGKPVAKLDAEDAIRHHVYLARFNGYKQSFTDQIDLLLQDLED